MNPEQFTVHLNNIATELQQAIGNDLLQTAGNIAAKAFKKNFQGEGFFGEGWQEVDRRKPGTKAYKAVEKKHPNDTKRKILTGRTGNLGRSIDYRVVTGAAVVYSDTEYGKYHNDGDGKIPKRQFIGNSPTLEKEIKDAIKERVDAILRQ
jgi:phage gpG-like protein